MAEIFSLKQPLTSIYYQEQPGWLNKNRSSQEQAGGEAVDGEISAGALRLTFPIKRLMPPEPKPEDQENPLNRKYELKLEPKPPQPKNLLDEFLKELEETLGQVLGMFGFDIGDECIEVHNKKPMAQSKLPNMMQQIQEMFNSIARQKQMPVKLEQPKLTQQPTSSNRAKL